MDRDRGPVDPPPQCSKSGCGGDATFFVYDAESREWRAICPPHARQFHPSLEVHAWLESGYMKPVESGNPEGPPPEPRSEREEAFRAVVEETMGWSE